MNYNIFIDSDIILDVLLQRVDFYKDSYAIFSLCEKEEINLYTSSSIILNVQYIGGKLSSKKSAAKVIHYLVENFINIINPTKRTILKGYESNFLDAEDAIQYFTAVDSGIIDYIITRNIKDYKNAPQQLPILTPMQFLKLAIQN